jgi:hypothetical protein
VDLTPSTEKKINFGGATIFASKKGNVGGADMMQWRNQNFGHAYIFPNQKIKTSAIPMVFSPKKSKLRWCLQSLHSKIQNFGGADMVRWHQHSVQEVSTIFPLKNSKLRWHRHSAQVSTHKIKSPVLHTLSPPKNKNFGTSCGGAYTSKNWNFGGAYIFHPKAAVVPAVLPSKKSKLRWCRCCTDVFTPSPFKNQHFSEVYSVPIQTIKNLVMPTISPLKKI